jgi:PAS domain S-box-containing protein
MPQRPEFLSIYYRALADNMPLSLLVKDIHGEILFANKSYLEFSDRKHKDLVGTSDYDFVAPELAKKYRANDAIVIESAQTLSGFGKHQTNDGQTLMMEHRRIPVCDDAGQVIAIQFLCWDVTQQQDTENALANERFLFNSLLEVFPDAIYFKDHDSRLTRLSKSFAQKFDRKPSEIIGLTDADLFAPEHANNALADEQRILETGQPINSKLEYEVYPDQKPTWASTTKVRLEDNSGNVMGTFGISRDVTELMESRKQLQDALARADDANRAKSEFVANMSHEIRTPMNGIIGMAKLLSETSLNDTQFEYVEMIQQASGSLMGLLNDILDFSKIEAGKLELDHIPFNLSDSVGKTTQSLSTKASEKGLELACRVSPNLPERLVGDPRRLRQVIVNLVGNAIKFTDMGEIVVEVEMQEQTGDLVKLHFSVRDTGIGIPSKKQKLIFEEFSQADSSTTRRFGGTGLGLTICKQLVQLMHGSIWVESEVSQGTTFHFSIPMRIAAEQPSTSRFKLESLQGIRTLVVDDNATNRRIVEEMIKSWGLVPTNVDGGVSAITALQTASRAGTPFQLILLDCMMPGMDGFSVAELVSGNPVFANPTIIMISSAVGLGDSIRCQEAGITHYMTKPVIKSELFDVIVDALGQEDARTRKKSTTQPYRSSRPLNILVVEDDPINQRVAVGFLEQAGHQITIANTGKEAITIVDELANERNQSFDVILMDLQMPEMDGLKTTAVIRERETSSETRVPIVAMTAAAMKGDRERCLAAGMDAYVSKPIALEQLLQIIESQTGIARQPETPPSAQTPASAAPPRSNSSVIDIATVAAEYPGDRSSLNKTLGIFLKELPRLLSEMSVGLTTNDLVIIKRTAHTILGSTRILRMDQLADIAQKLEAYATKGDVDRCHKLHSKLSALSERAIDEITDFLS